jgi:uncharacterized protein YbaR (Trm112 family)
MGFDNVACTRIAMVSELRVSAQARELLACPRSHERLTVGTEAGVALSPIARTGTPAPRFDLTTLAAYTGDRRRAYPIAEGFPALLWPEVHGAPATEVADLGHRNYAEAYAEMEHYNPTSRARAEAIRDSDAYATVQRILAMPSAANTFPEPLEIWLDAVHDTGAQGDCYRFLAPLTGKTFLQLGGDGRHAVKAVMAGATNGILVTPMIGEAVFAWTLAGIAGVQARFSCVLGVGEEIPLVDNSIDAMYSPGCLHHMALETALPEIRRVLKPGGRFCGHEPWRAPLYAVGTSVFGKREHGLLDRGKSIYCQPFTSERLQPLGRVFPKHVIANHGPLLRYPLIALNKFGLRLSLPTMIALAKVDDRVGGAIGLGGKWGGSVMIGGEKPAP